MPYAKKTAGIYTINCRANSTAYVGQTNNLSKRFADHFNLLRSNRHPNPRLQNTFNKYGEKSFMARVEVECADTDDLDTIENACLTGELKFEVPVTMNIANDAGSVMRGRRHTDSTKSKIAETKKASAKVGSDPELSRRVKLLRLTDPIFRAKVDYIVKNDHLSFAERARFVGLTLSTTRKKYMMYCEFYGKTYERTRPSYERDVKEKLEFIKNNIELPSTKLAEMLHCSATSVGALIRRYKLR